MCLDDVAIKWGGLFRATMKRAAAKNIEMETTSIIRFKK